MPVNSIADNQDVQPAETRVRLDRFDPGNGLDRGRGRMVELAWYLCKCMFFLSPLPWPYGLKRALLRLFGAAIGNGVVIKPRVNIHLPWRLSIGEHAWVGEEVFILNFEHVTIGRQACLSQRAFLCTGNHNFRDPRFSYRNQPISVGDGAWVGAQAFVGPGIGIGIDAVITAGSIVTKDLPPAMICSGNPCVAIKPRWQ